MHKYLAIFSYHPVPHTTSLWKCETRDIIFTLVVNDFGSKYTNKDDAEYLNTALQQLYNITVDWTGSKYL